MTEGTKRNESRELAQPAPWGGTAGGLAAPPHPTPHPPAQDASTQERPAASRPVASLASGPLFSSREEEQLCGREGWCHG